MATTEKGARLTVELGDPSLYAAICHAAIDRNQSVGSIVAKALRKWLDEHEAKADFRDSLAAEEARRDGEPSVSLDDYARSRGWRV